MCGSMVDIQSVIAEIREGKKKNKTKILCPHLLRRAAINIEETTSSKI